MSEPKSNELVHQHGPKATLPVVGHGGTKYEGVDASVKMVLFSLSIIALTLVVTALITLPIQNVLKTTNPPGNLPSPLAPERVIPAEPVLQVHPWTYLPDLRAHEDAVLGSYGKDASGQVHVPIGMAMDAVVPQLQSRTGAQPGLTIPGGQGREFATGKLSSLPPQYQVQTPAQPPAIQGEIRKNAR